MKHAYLRQSLLTITLLASQLVTSADNPANQFIQFVHQTDDDSQSECTQRGGQRVYAVNTHPQAIIDVHIDRFFSGVRQAGRSMFAIAPDHRQALGCDTVMESQQSWELMKADFVDEAFALERYGQIVGDP
jgi:hypothetical protein